MPLVSCPIHEHALAIPGHPALCTPLGKLSYQALDKQIRQFQLHLLKTQVGEGDRVAIVSNQADLVIPLLFALFRNKSIAFVLNPKLPADTLETWIQQSKCSKVFTNEDMTSVLAEEAEIDENLPTLFSTAQLATFFLTSGSSGPPKCAVHRLGNHLYSALGSAQQIPLQPHHQWLLNLPLYHVGGQAILWRCFKAGASVALPGSSTYSHVSMVPTQLYRLLQDPTQQLPENCQILLGGGPVSVCLLNQATRAKLAVRLTYGLTEMGSQVATSAIKAPGDDLDSGSCLPHRKLKLDKQGQVLVKGDCLFEGYLNQDLISISLSVDGYYQTGDLGTLSEDGTLRLTGRADNLFISGGENIQPEEIEAQLCQLPGVINAIVVPKNDPEFGQRPVAFLESTAAFQQDSWKQDLEKVLPRYKIPVQLFPWPVQEQGALKPSRATCKAIATAI